MDVVVMIVLLLAVSAIPLILFANLICTSDADDDNDDDIEAIVEQVVPAAAPAMAVAIVDIFIVVEAPLSLPFCYR